VPSLCWWWDQFTDKYGFDDGDEEPPGAQIMRDLLVEAINLALGPGTTLRAYAYDRPGMHNSTMIVFGIPFSESDPYDKKEPWVFTIDDTRIEVVPNPVWVSSFIGVLNDDGFAERVRIRILKPYKTGMATQVRQALRHTLAGNHSHLGPEYDAEVRSSFEESLAGARQRVVASSILVCHPEPGPE